VYYTAAIDCLRSYVAGVIDIRVMHQEGGYDRRRVTDMMDRGGYNQTSEVVHHRSPCLKKNRDLRRLVERCRLQEVGVEQAR
jgi:hypothetical protein